MQQKPSVSLMSGRVWFHQVFVGMDWLLMVCFHNKSGILHAAFPFNNKAKHSRIRKCQGKKKSCELNWTSYLCVLQRLWSDHVPFLFCDSPATEGPLQFEVATLSFFSRAYGFVMSHYIAFRLQRSNEAKSCVCRDFATLWSKWHLRTYSCRFWSRLQTKTKFGREFLPFPMT